jgi:hypothetical protein
MHVKHIKTRCLRFLQNSKRMFLSAGAALKLKRKHDLRVEMCAHERGRLMLACDESLQRSY